MRITILGGGSAGWLTAAGLIEAYPHYEVSLIESDDLHSVGVGESSLPSLKAFLKKLGLKEEDWMPYCNATLKASVDFTGWNKPGVRVKEPFGPQITQYSTRPFFDWVSAQESGEDLGGFHEFSTGWSRLLDLNKVAESDTPEFSDWCLDECTSYHINASMLGTYLRDHYCIPKGVRRLEGEVVDVETSQGDIQSLTLRSGERVTSDIFVDCSGFGRVLMKALEVAWRPIDTVANDSAVVVKVPYTCKDVEMEFSTNATTLPCGWAWNIPLWNEVSVGYVYNSDFATRDEAHEQLVEFIKSSRGMDIEDFDVLHLSTVPGVLEQMAKGNTFAIGLSQGFLEPLGSTGVHLIITGIETLLEVINMPGGLSNYHLSIFNSIMLGNYAEFEEVIRSHYLLSTREDTPYWKHVRSLVGAHNPHGFLSDQIPKLLRGLANATELNLSPIELSILANNGVRPLCTPGLPDRGAKLRRDLTYSLRVQDTVIDSIPTLYQYLKDNIYNQKA